MQREKLIKIGAGIVIIAAIVFLWPHYRHQVPQTAGEQAQAVVAEIADVPPAAPLTLVTEPDDGMAPVQQAIANAKTSLDLVMYELEDPQIEQELVDAQARGVALRVILQNVSTFGQHPNQAAYDFLKADGVPVVWAAKYFALTHQKTLIVDGQWALIMTFNLNPKYYASSRDFGIADPDPKDVAAIAAAFESDWTGSQVTASNGRDLVWSPGSADTLLALINGASKTLDIYNEEMADTRIQDALEKAAARGVAVRVDMTYSTSWKTALNELAADGVQVKTYPSTADFYIHAKGIIADGTRMFLGSENFSAQSLDANRELGILISKADIIASVQGTFNKDWAGSRSYAGSVPASSDPNAAAGIVKLSASGICHPPDDASYNQTKTFTPYNNIEDCQAAGGRLPSNYHK